jgi:hypothetical protein
MSYLTLSSLVNAIGGGGRRSAPDAAPRAINRGETAQIRGAGRRVAALAPIHRRPGLARKLLGPRKRLAAPHALGVTD